MCRGLGWAWGFVGPYGFKALGLRSSAAAIVGVSSQDRRFRAESGSMFVWLTDLWLQ